VANKNNFDESAAVSVEKASHRKPKLNAACEQFEETKNCWKSSDEKISVLADQDKDFKKCCLSTGRYDGSQRNYFFRE
jgi:hypothetical protein